jgi:hypothetical protein
MRSTLILNLLLLEFLSGPAAAQKEIREHRLQRPKQPTGEIPRESQQGKADGLESVVSIVNGADKSLSFQLKCDNGVWTIQTLGIGSQKDFNGCSTGMTFRIKTDPPGVVNTYALAVHERYQIVLNNSTAAYDLVKLTPR